MVDVSDIPQGETNEVWQRHKETFGETYDQWRAHHAFDRDFMETLLRKALIEERPVTNESLNKLDPAYGVESPGPEITL